MGVLNRLRTGLVFYDDFWADSPLRPEWEVSPSDPARYSLSENPGHLRLKGGQDTLRFLLPAPSGSYVLDASIAFVPVSAEQACGIAVWESDQAYVEVVEVSGTDARLFPRLRLICQDGLFTGYHSEDGATWTNLGTQPVSMVVGRPGLVFRGPAGTSADVDWVKVFRDRFLVVQNLVAGQKVQVFRTDPAPSTLEAEATCPPGESAVSIDLGAKPLPLRGFIRVTEADGVTVLGDGPEVDLWAGDIWSCDLVPDLRYLGETLVEGAAVSVGQLQGAETLVSFELYNPHPVTLVSVQVAVEDAGEFGEEWCAVAPDDAGSPGAFGQQALLGSLAPGATLRFWFRVRRDPALLPPPGTAQGLAGLRIDSVVSG